MAISKLREMQRELITVESDARAAHELWHAITNGTARGDYWQAKMLWEGKHKRAGELRRAIQRELRRPR